MNSLLAALILSSAMVLVLVAKRRPPRLEVEDFPSGMRRTIALALLVATLGIACVLPLLQYETADPHAEGLDLPFGALFVGHGLLASCLFSWWLLAGRPSLTRFLAIGLKDLPGSLRLGLFTGVAGWATTILVMAVIGGLASTIEPATLPEEATVPSLVRLIVELPWYQRLLLVLSAGIVEEAFFRSFLQVRGGLLLSSLLFTTSHMTYGLPLLLVGVFTLSMIFGWVFRARANVLPCMVAHSIFDAIQLFIILPVVVTGS